MVDLAGMKQCSSSSLLHHAFEDSVIPGVGRVGDVKVVATTQGTRIHAGKQEIFIIILTLFIIRIRRQGSFSCKGRSDADN